MDKASDTTSLSPVALAVYCEKDFRTSLLIAYPDAESAESGPLRDPLHDFINLRECYTLDRNGEGCIFSYYTRIADGSLMKYAVSVPAGSEVSGRRIVALLRELEMATIDHKHLPDLIQIEYMLRRIGLERRSGAAEGGSLPADEEFVDARECYRTYMSTSDVMRIFSYPYQKAYGTCGRIIIAEATGVLAAGADLPRITAPVEEMVTLMLEFSDGREVGIRLPMTRQSDERRELRGGSFHGFRARMIHEDMFRVEMTPPMPDFDVQARTPGMSPAVKLAVAPDEEKPQKSDWEPQPMRRRRSRRNGWAWVVALAVVALVAAGLIVYYMPAIVPSNSYDGMDMVDVTADSTAVVPAAVPAPADTMAADTAQTVAEASAIPVVGEEETADVDYLNRNKVWHADSLKSQKYRDFFHSFAKADIEAVARADYFYVRGQSTNETANRMIAMLWAAYNTPVQRSNEMVLRELRGKESIDLLALYNRLALYRDPTPNKTPRPQN